MKHCKHCNISHPETGEFWLTRSTGHLRCRESHRMHGRAWRKDNPERLKELQNKHYHVNRDKIIQRNYKYAKGRKLIDTNYKLTMILRQRLNKALKGNYKVGSAVKDLGCTIEQFKSHIESLFSPGMTWENYGRTGWHIDHIKPISKVDLTNPEQLKQVLHYSNLQPLWAKDNILKGNK